MRVLGLILLVTCLIVGCAETAERSDAGAADAAGESRTTTVSETTAEDSETGSDPTHASGLRTVTIHASSGESVRVRVEIADDDFERARGLMYRTELAEDRGMLFIYPYEDELTFWMKNTLIPLSIAFMDSEGRIVDIQDMKPEGVEQTVPDAWLPRYVSAEPAQYALEVNQGFFEERGVKVEDRAELPA
jgi:uncharacterized membrane protein (UPF0127 family)